MPIISLLRAILIIIGKPVYLLLSFPFRLPHYLPRITFRWPTFSFSIKQFLKSIHPIVYFFTSRPVRRPKHRHVFNYRFLVTWSLAFLFLVFSIGAFSLYWFVFKDLPSPSTLASKPYPLTTHIRDRNGTELYKLYASENRTLVELSKVPAVLRQATISIEDKDFYRHQGFSFRGILRAALNNFSCALSTEHCEITIQGGSTITQQLVKTALLTPERTIQRKLREIVLSIWVEHLYTKDQILEMYLNRVSYGGATYGVAEAAQTYFGKSVSQLTLAEAALLAGLPASPTAYSPYGAHPELAKARQKDVLRRMVADNYITWDQAEAASLVELTIRPPEIQIKAPHFVMYIRELLEEKYGRDILQQGGLDIITSLDLPTQEMAQNVVTSETAKVAYLKVGNGAAIVTNPQTGEILAMVGSRDYFDLAHDGNVNVTLSPRQPGSSIKPINYALAFQNGYTPASFIEDAPVTYKFLGSPPYSPVNYDRRYHGKLTLRQALANSYNIPAVKILNINGVSNMVELARKMGITTWTDSSRFGLALTLGGGEVRMLDMASVYGILASLGQKVAFHPILSVRDSHGNVLEEFRCPASTFKPSSTSPKSSFTPTEVTTCPTERILDPKIAFQISDILSDNVARTPVFGPHSDLYIPGSAVAVKTGTTNDLRDNWTIGYTENRVVVVWVGNNDNSPMSYVASGITGASPIWRKITDHLLSVSPHTTFTLPPDLLKVSICTLTGQLACNGCPARTEYFTPGTEPTTACAPDAIKKLVEERAKLHPTPPHD